MARSKMTPDQAMEASVPYIYAPTTPRARIEEDFAIRRKRFTSLQGYMAQLQGILSWEAYSRLSAIRVPTLVIHGESDRLVPPANGRLIAERIPGARLVMLPQASHIFTTDQPKAALAAILDFLSEQSS
jgi:pimeloyl-ACP methyl ester carboxylesterase